MTTDQEPDRKTRERNYVVIVVVLAAIAVALYFGIQATQDEGRVFDAVAPALVF